MSARVVCVIVQHLGHWTAIHSLSLSLPLTHLPRNFGFGTKHKFLCICAVMEHITMGENACTRFPLSLTHSSTSPVSILHLSLSPSNSFLQFTLKFFIRLALGSFAALPERQSFAKLPLCARAGDFLLLLIFSSFTLQQPLTLSHSDFIVCHTGSSLSHSGGSQCTEAKLLLFFSCSALFSHFNQRPACWLKSFKCFAHVIFIM